MNYCNKYTKLIVIDCSILNADDLSLSLHIFIYIDLKVLLTNGL